MRTCHNQAVHKALIAISALIVLTAAGCSPGTFKKDWDENCQISPKPLFSAITEEGETMTIVVKNTGKSGRSGENADCSFDVVFRWYQDHDNDTTTAKVLQEAKRITVAPGEETAVLKGSQIYSVHIENARGGSAATPRCKGQAEIKA